MTLSFAPEAIELWPLDRLRPYAANAKMHGEDQVVKIAASMAEFGWTVPVLVSGDGEVIAGHGRILAAAQLGLTEVPVIILDQMSEAQRRAYRIADNQLTALGTWDEGLLSKELQELLGEDYDLSLIGFEDGELDRLLNLSPDGESGSEEGTAPVVIPEPPRNPVSRAGDLWLLGDHRLLCGDSTNHTDVRRLMNGERAVLFATDPPYLVDYDGSNHPTRNKDWSQSYGVTWDDSSQGAELYDGFIAAAVADAITENAAWYCWHASRRQAMLEACWERAGAFVHQQIIWVKDRGVLTRSHYLWKHEPCFMGWRRPNRPPKVAEETLPSTWEMPSFAKDERPDHPTPKPLEAFGIPMRQHVARGGVCYEPFSGSGSQIMAGEANGRRVYAMEISPAYVDVAIERWQAETGRRAVLETTGQTFAQVKDERLSDVAGAPDAVPAMNTAPKGHGAGVQARARGAGRLTEQVLADEGALLPMARTAMEMLMRQVMAVSREIAMLDRQLLAWHAQSEASRRLSGIPGLGILTATALAATVTDPEQFHSGRQFAAWLGLTPQQHSTGGETQLAGISKQGDRYLRRLLVVGATAVIRHIKDNPTPMANWVRKLMEKKPFRLVSVALANKLARIAWVVLTRKEAYQPHKLPA